MFGKDGVILYHILNQNNSSGRKAITELSVYPKLNHYYNSAINESLTFVGSGISQVDDQIGSVNLVQTTAAQRPEKHDDWFRFNSDRTQDKGFVTDGDITYVELFTTINFDRDLDFDNDATFETNEFATLIGGSAAFTAEKRIAGDDNSDDLLTSASIDASGRVRINNATESNQGVLPLDYSVLHAANFSGATTTTDTISWGYADTVADRGWSGFGQILITTNAALTEAERKELYEWMLAEMNASTKPRVAANTVAPVVSGFVITGQTLSVTDGTWDRPVANFTYQWKRAGVAISGATSSTYTVVSADEGNAITCDVTADGAVTATSNSLSATYVSPSFGASEYEDEETVTFSLGSYSGATMSFVSLEVGTTDVTAQVSGTSWASSITQSETLTLTVRADDGINTADITQTVTLYKHPQFVESLFLPVADSISGTGSAITVSIDLSSLSTQQGDLVIVCVAENSNTDRTTNNASTGWANVGDFYRDDTNDTNVFMFTKVMGATPDTTFSCDITSSNVNDSIAWSVMVIRGGAYNNIYDSARGNSSDTIFPAISGIGKGRIQAHFATGAMIDTLTNLTYNNIADRMNNSAQEGYELATRDLVLGSGTNKITSGSQAEFSIKTAQDNKRNSSIGVTLIIDPDEPA